MKIFLTTAVEKLYGDLPVAAHFHTAEPLLLPSVLSTPFSGRRMPVTRTLKDVVGKNIRIGC